MEQRFSEYVNNLGRALGLNQSDILQLNGILRRFSDTDKFKLVNNTEETVRKLIEVDKKINDLVSGELKPYMASIQDSWNKINFNLAELQILTLIQRKENCDELINELLRLFTTKVSTVNEILKKKLDESTDTQAKQSARDLLSKVSSSNQSMAPLLKTTTQTPLVQPKWDISQPDSAKTPLGKTDIKKVAAQFKANQSKSGTNYLLKYLKYKKNIYHLKKILIINL